MVEGNNHKHSRILLLVSIPNLSQKLNQIEKLIINMSKINNKDLLIREFKKLKNLMIQIIMLLVLLHKEELLGDTVITAQWQTTLNTDTMHPIYLVRRILFFLRIINLKEYILEMERQLDLQIPRVPYRLFK